MDSLDGLTSPFDSVAVPAVLSLSSDASMDFILSNVEFKSQRALELVLSNITEPDHLSTGARLGLAAALAHFPNSSIVSTIARKHGSTFSSSSLDSESDSRTLMSRRRKSPPRSPNSTEASDSLSLVIELLQAGSNASNELSRLTEDVQSPQQLSSLVHAVEQAIFSSQDLLNEHQAHIVCDLLQSILVVVLSTPAFAKALSGDEALAHAISKICTDITSRYPSLSDLVQTVGAIAVSLGQVGKVSFSADVARSESCLDMCTRALQAHHFSKSTEMQWSQKAVQHIQQVLEAATSACAAKFAACSFASCCQTAMSVDAYQAYADFIGRALGSISRTSVGSPHDAMLLLDRAILQGPMVSAESIATFLVQSFFSQNAPLAHLASQAAKTIATSNHARGDLLVASISQRLLRLSQHEIMPSAALDFLSESLFSDNFLDEFAHEGAMRLFPLPTRLIEPWEACKMVDLALSEAHAGTDVPLHRLLLIVSVAKQREQNAHAIMKHLSLLVASGDGATNTWLSSAGRTTQPSNWWPLGCGALFLFFATTFRLVTLFSIFAADSLPSRAAHSMFCALYLFVPLETAAVVPPEILQRAGISSNSVAVPLHTSPSPILKIMHNLALKLGQKADMGEVVYLLLRKLILTHPILSTSLAPLLVDMLHGRAESLKQHHAQHKQRHSAAKIVSGYFEDFVFARQEHKCILFALGLADSMLATFLNNTEGTIHILTVPSSNLV
jgi:hypothetical protein